ncbi:hypothetical protein ASG93_10740 [Paenibacillus sp. Soil787]|nr:hypothetical protein ASG93_10740 [Paenibacillus sp. Soil787]
MHCLRVGTNGKGCTGVESAKFAAILRLAGNEDPLFQLICQCWATMGNMGTLFGVLEVFRLRKWEIADPRSAKK